MTNFRQLFCLALVGLCTACGGETSDPAANTQVTETFAPTTSVTGDSSINLIPADCGTVNVSTTATPGLSFDDAGTVLTGTAVTGIIDSNDENNSSHYWRVLLFEGRYHSIIDSTRIDTTANGVGIGIRTLHSDGEDTQQFYGFSNERGQRGRLWQSTKVDFVGNLFSAVLNYRIDALPGSGAQRYEFLVLANSRSLPSPYLLDCPQVVTTSIGTTTTLELPTGDTKSQEVWVLVDRPEDRVGVDLSMFSTDIGIDTDIGFFSSVGSGLVEPFPLTSPANSLSGSVTFTPPTSYNGDSYLVRFRNFGPATTITAGFSAKPTEDSPDGVRSKEEGLIRWGDTR